MEVILANDFPCGLREVMSAAGLGHRTEHAEDWCIRNGAAYLDECEEEIDDFASALHLDEKERIRFIQGIAIARQRTGDVTGCVFRRW